MEIVIGMTLSTLITLATAYFIDYAKAKGKNLADKEDIRRITQLVESVKQENQLILEQMRSRLQLRLAAAEKRLQAHQEAFVFWRGLLKTVHTDGIGTIVDQCQTWWEHNCLYLSAEARDAFNLAYSCAGSHRTYLQGPRDAQSAEVAKRNWSSIMAAGNIIVAGVNLPSLGEREGKDVTNGSDVSAGQR
jgi:hypothetical protein